MKALVVSKLDSLATQLKLTAINDCGKMWLNIVVGLKGKIRKSRYGEVQLLNGVRASCHLVIEKNTAVTYVDIIEREEEGQFGKVDYFSMILLVGES